MYGFQQPYGQPAYVPPPPPNYGGYGMQPARPTVIQINADDHSDETVCAKCAKKTLSIT
jgi:hypothetical protein